MLWGVAAAALAAGDPERPGVAAPGIHVHRCGRNTIDGKIGK